MDRVLKELKETITPNQLVISVAASVTSSFVQERLKEGVPVVRAMPNTPSVINAGMAGLCAGIHANAEQIAVAEAIFKCVGETVFVDESLMDAVTALSASGPAYLYVVVESLAEAGVKLGIPRETATLLAAQTMFGAAKMVLDSKLTQLCSKTQSPLQLLHHRWTDGARRRQAKSNSNQSCCKSSRKSTRASQQPDSDL